MLSKSHKLAVPVVAATVLSTALAIADLAATELLDRPVQLDLVFKLHVDDSLAEQDIYIEREKGSGLIYRPTKAERDLNQPLYAAADPIEHQPFEPDALGPWKKGKGDMIRDMAEACRKHGIHLSIYLSPWDMNQGHKGVYDTPAYNALFQEQLKELLTNYGKVADVWFDGAHAPGCHGKPYNAALFDWLGHFKMIRKLQPGATISVMGPDVRWCGNEAGRSRQSEWSVLPSTKALSKDPFKLMDSDKRDKDLGSRSKLGNARSLVWYPAQVNTSIRPGWFWRASENGKVKSLDHLLHIYFGSVGGNGQFLLNLPLDTRGKIHENDVTRMRQLRNVLDATFKENLATGASATASHSLSGHGPDQTIDGDKLTYWSTRDWQETAELEIRLAGTKTFNGNCPL